jgi:hypothetical protein
LKCFQKWFWTKGGGHGGKRSGGFKKKRHWWLCIHPGQLTLATTLPRYVMGLSPKFICLGARSLVLYKGSWYLRNMVHVTQESRLSPRMGQYISRHIPSCWKTLGFSHRGTGVMFWRRYCRDVPGR